MCTVGSQSPYVRPKDGSWKKCAAATSRHRTSRPHGRGSLSDTTPSYAISELGRMRKSCASPNRAPAPPDCRSVPVRKPPQAATRLIRQVGLTPRAGGAGLTALPTIVGEALGLRSAKAPQQRFTTPRLPVPENPTDRGAQDVASAE